MASHILLVIASFLAIICALPTASDLSPLQDSCVADPTSSAGKCHPFLLQWTPCTCQHIKSHWILGLALVHGYFAPGGIGTPPRATEISTVLEGSLLAGFVTSNPENRLVWKVHASKGQSPGLIPVSDLFATNPSNIPDDILAKAFPAG
uniref:Cupin type-1 domain-containing protein n=1 Tax=Populus trichocarpa TaxID=3694 RepID=A0A2K2CE44_POPTR